MAKIGYLIVLLILSGCVSGDKMVRIVETGAAGSYIPFVDAQVKGLRVETSKDPIQGNIIIEYRLDDGSTVKYHSEGLAPK